MEDVIFRLAPFVHLLFSVALRITFPNKIADFRDRLIFFFALNIFLSDHGIKFVRSKNIHIYIVLYAALKEIRRKEMFK